MKPSNDQILDQAREMIKSSYLVDPEGDSDIFTAQDMQDAYQAGFDDGYDEAY